MRTLHLTDGENDILCKILRSIPSSKLYIQIECDGYVATGVDMYYYNLLLTHILKDGNDYRFKDAD